MDKRKKCRDREIFLGKKKKEKDNKDTLYQLQSFPRANLITMRQQ